jgi:hypothetical protein
MPAAVAIWIWFCAFLNAAGWALSAIHQLNAGGYVAALLVWFAALFVWRRKTSEKILPQIRWQKFHRFRRPFPLAFLVLAAMAFLGGVIYAPDDYDALAYRLPRILHWLAAGQWHWIHTIFPRLNVRATGVEWVSAPFIALLKTDRLLFLINTVSFLFLPGLVFSVFTRLGVRRRVAWHWMWIAPTGYCFLLQAGGICNDLFGAAFALAAVDFALRAKASQSPRDFLTAILAAAMLTNCKLSDLALLLPWALAMLPSARLALRWPARTLAVCLLALSASILPITIFNLKFAGDWTGEGLSQGGAHNAALKAGANVFLTAAENFVPPILPQEEQWNDAIARAIPPELGRRLDAVMEHPGNKLAFRGQMQTEENAGLGFGVSALLLASILAATLSRRKSATTPRQNAGERLWQIAVRGSPWISLLVFMTQSYLSGPGRILTPFYLLLMPLLLAVAGHERLVTRRWWRAAGMAVFAIAAVMLVVAPARPLFPAQTILEKMTARFPDSRLLARMEKVYAVYRSRNDAFAPVRVVLPPDAAVLGLVTFDDPETSLWRPFGSRHVEHVCPGDTAADLQARGIQFVLLNAENFEPLFHRAPEDWMKQMNARVVQKIPLELRAQQGARDWYLLRLP